MQKTKRSKGTKTSRQIRTSQRPTCLTQGKRHLDHDRAGSRCSWRALEAPGTSPSCGTATEKHQDVPCFASVNPVGLRTWSCPLSENSAHFLLQAPLGTLSATGHRHAKSKSEKTQTNCTQKKVRWGDSHILLFSITLLAREVIFPNLTDDSGYSSYFAASRPRMPRSSDRLPTSPLRAKTCFYTRLGKNFTTTFSKARS